MKIEYFTSGSGITQKRKLKRSAQTPEEMHELMAESEPSKSYLEYVADIERQARNHLSKRGLPSELGGAYRKVGTTWQRVPGNDFNLPRHSSRSAIFQIEGYEEDSEAGFSARIIELASKLRASVSAGKIEAALDYAHAMGVLTTELKFKRMWEKLALQGQDQRESAKRGQAEKCKNDAARHARWRVEAERVRSKRENDGLPSLDYIGVAREVRTNLKLVQTERTIDRAIRKRDVR